MTKTITLLLLLCITIPCFSQQETTDSSTLGEVIVKAFEQNKNRRDIAAVVQIIEFNNADRYNKTSLVNGFNTVPAVRMEERSPGSYRINIRGSSLRSPFGVRNVKVYWNDIPVTDPGGNTYFNQFAWNNFSYIEIVKGPAGSMYGAGTGGLILLNSFGRWQPGASLEYVTGSYHLQNLFTSVRFGEKNNKNELTYSHNQTDGYRIQTKMRRDNFSWQSRLKLSEKQELTASVLFNDMYYQTPGALTLAEFKANPKSARPAGGGFPSAVNAKAAIFQKNITAGFTNQYQFNASFKNTTVIYGAFNQVKNAAIRNYERRNEPGYGARTLFVYSGQEQEKSNWKLLAGSEYQQGFFNTQVSKNKNGNPDTLQTNDDINYKTYNFFIQGDLSLGNTWFFTSGVSLNKTKVIFSRLNKYPVIEQARSYRNEMAPRFSLRKNISDNFNLKATVSRGFSPPTVAELLPSTGVISTDLEAEYGWNYEMTAHADFLKRKLFVEITGVYLKLNNALVQRRDLSGADYFVNAGDVQQKGIEFSSNYFKSFSSNALFSQVQLSGAYTYSHYRYGQFIKGTENFSGKTVPSVPSHTVSLLADVIFRKGIYLDATYYSASGIFLNDANTAIADPYHLLGMRIGYKTTLNKKYKISLYTGADNLLDETYSLGNDINAAANRFYNAAPGRNYYAGISFQWLKQNAK